MIVGRNDSDVNIRHTVHARDPVVVEVGLLDRTVPKADFLGQSQTEAINDAALELRNDVVGLHRDAAVHDTPEL